MSVFLMVGKTKTRRQKSLTMLPECMSDRRQSLVWKELRFQADTHDKRRKKVVGEEGGGENDLRPKK